MVVKHKPWVIFMGGKRRMHLGERTSSAPQHMQISFRYLKNRKGGIAEPARARQNCVKYVNVKTLGPLLAKDDSQGKTMKTTSFSCLKKRQEHFENWKLS